MTIYSAGVPSIPSNRLRRLRGLPDVGKPPPPIALPPKTIRINGDLFTFDPNMDWPYRHRTADPDIDVAAESKLLKRWPHLPPAPVDWWSKKVW